MVAPISAHVAERLQTNPKALLLLKKFTEIHGPLGVRCGKALRLMRSATVQASARVAIAAA